LRFAALLLACALSACGLGKTAGPDMSVVLAEEPAKTLSAYRLFTDASASSPAPGVVPYDLVNPLFSDHAVKHRFVHVPGGAPAVLTAVGEVNENNLSVFRADAAQALPPGSDDLRLRHLDDHHQRVEGGRVLREPLAGLEREQGDVARALLREHAAGDPVLGVAEELGEAPVRAMLTVLQPVLAFAPVLETTLPWAATVDDVLAAFAERAVVSRRSLVKIDPDLSFEEAALFGCAVLTGVVLWPRNSNELGVSLRALVQGREARVAFVASASFTLIALLILLTNSRGVAGALLFFNF